MILTIEKLIIDSCINLQRERETDLPMVTLSPIMVGKTLPARLDLATWTRELSCTLVPDPIRMLLTSPGFLLKIY